MDPLIIKFKSRIDGGVNRKVLKKRGSSDEFHRNKHWILLIVTEFDSIWERRKQNGALNFEHKLK